MSWIARLRRFARTKPIGLAIPAGLVLAIFANVIMQSVAESIVMPVIQSAFTGDGQARGLTLTVAGTTLQFARVIRDFVVLIAIAAIGYTLALRPLRGDLLPAPGRRCPECRSRVVVDATRCPFCRSSLSGVR